jgi:hypothetical protein
MNGSNGFFVRGLPVGLLWNRQLPDLYFNTSDGPALDGGFFLIFLEKKLCTYWQQIPEIPPNPPLSKGGVGIFLGLYASLFPARPD